MAHFTFSFDALWWLTQRFCLLEESIKCKSLKYYIGCIVIKTTINALGNSCTQMWWWCKAKWQAEKYQLQSTEKPGNGAPLPDLDNSTKGCMRLKPQKMCLKAVTWSDLISPICQTSTSVGVGVLIATVLGFDVEKSEMIFANPRLLQIHFLPWQRVPVSAEVIQPSAKAYTERKAYTEIRTGFVCIWGRFLKAGLDGLIGVVKMQVFLKERES